MEGWSGGGEQCRPPAFLLDPGLLGCDKATVYIQTLPQVPVKGKTWAMKMTLGLGGCKAVTQGEGILQKTASW